MPYRMPPRPRPSKKKHYVAVIPDVHVGYIVDTPTYSVGAWDLCMQALQHDAKRLTHIIILGDFGNWESLSHWSGIRADQVFVEEDVALVRARLAEVFAIADKHGILVVFCEGNHEAWASLFEAKYPAMRNVVNLQRRLGFRGKGRLWVPENHFYRLGRSHYTHGHLRGVKTPKDMVRRTGVSVLYGHTHHFATESVRMLDGEHAAWTMGCLASIDPPPPYARGAQPDGWVHGFGRVQVRANGLFQVGFRRVVEEAWTELEDGTELRVDLKACRRRLDEDARIREQLREEYEDRFYSPGGPVVTSEPHHGRTDRKGRVSTVARNRRARIMRLVPPEAR